MSANGPQPAAGTVCYGELDATKAQDHETCHQLGEGEIEAIWQDDNPLAEFFGQRADAPPKWCHVKRYQAKITATGYEVWERQRRFGNTCAIYCEQMIQDCIDCHGGKRHSCESGWRDLMNTTMPGTATDSNPWGEKYVV